MELYRNRVWKCEDLCQGTGPQEHTHTQTHGGPGGEGREGGACGRAGNINGRRASEWTLTGTVPVG